MDSFFAPAIRSVLVERDKDKLLYRVKLLLHFTPITYWSAVVAMLLNKEVTMMLGMAKLLPDKGLTNDSDHS